MTQPAPFSLSVCVPVPRLHTALGRDAARPVDDCLPWDDARPSVLRNLPLSRSEARSCLQDFRTAPPEELSRAVQMAAAAYVADPLGRVEDAALDAFVLGNGHAPSGKPATADDKTAEQHRLAQRQLLTVWAQEERVLDIVRLTDRCEETERRLAGILQDPEFSDDADSEQASMQQDAQAAEPSASTETPLGQALNDVRLDDVRSLLPPWRFVLTHLLPFLPPDALLVVNDPDMAEAVRAAALPESAPVSGDPGLPEGLPVRVKIRCLAADAVNDAANDVVTDASLLFLLPAAPKGN